MRPAILFLLTGLLLSPAIGHTQVNYPPPGYPGQGNEENPGVLLHDGIEKLLAFVEGGGANDQRKLAAFVERDLTPYFDFVTMTRWSLGPQARFMDQEQRLAAVKQLRGMFLGALVRNLLQYDPGRVQYLPARGDAYTGDVILGLQSFPRRGYPLRLDFYVHRGAAGWRVVDVAANGLRATTVYREYFNRRGPGWGP